MIEIKSINLEIKIMINYKHFKCAFCKKFIKLDAVNKAVLTKFTPETPFNREELNFIHDKCITKIKSKQIVY